MGPVGLVMARAVAMWLAAPVTVVPVAMAAMVLVAPVAVTATKCSASSKSLDLFPLAWSLIENFA